MKIIVTILFYTCCMSALAIRNNSSHCTDVNCICLEQELEIELKDNTPPKTDYWKTGSGGKYFSNAHKISRALFPPQKAPARFILVKIMLYNSSSQSTRTEHYIWTLSCMYAVLPRYVLTLLSLGTLYHDREELELTIPQFCQDVPSEKYMEYALFSLQDFSIFPSTSDSRLNTATCVVKLDNSNGSKNQVTGYVQNWLSFTIHSLQIFVSLIVGFILTQLLIDYYDNVKKPFKESEDTKSSDGSKSADGEDTEDAVRKRAEREEAERKRAEIKRAEREDAERKRAGRLYAFRATAVVTVVLELVLCASVFVLIIFDGLDGFSIYIFACPSSLYILFFTGAFIAWICCRDSQYVIDFFLFLLSFAICYHFLWVLLGIFVNPVWAFSVLLPICSFPPLFYILAYYYAKARPKNGTGDRFALIICGIILVAFFAFVAFTWIFVKFFLANQLISSLIQTGLSTVLGVIFSFVAYLQPEMFEKPPSPRDENSSEPGEQNETQMNNRQFIQANSYKMLVIQN